MKFIAMLTSLMMIGVLAAFNPLLEANSQTNPIVTDATGLTTEQKIEKLLKSRDEFGSGDQMRRYFFGDLEPIAVQPGGAGMVVNLYNKANDITIAYCATYDVVIALKKGRVTEFSASEVK